MQLYDIQPQDLLFFRDGRPMETGEGVGHGAQWPMPTVLFDALHAALHRAFPETQPWEHAHTERRDKADTGVGRRFGSLTTLGPFPIHNGKWLFPAPLDARLSGTKGDGKEDGRVVCLRPLKKADGGVSDLPVPLTNALGNPAAPSKDEVSPWWNQQTIETFLKTGSVDRAALESGSFPHQKLYGPETTTGIGIDPTTGAQDGVQIYNAEYLRLIDETSLGLVASMPTPEADGDTLKNLFPAIGGRIVAGGQQRVCQVRPLDQAVLSDLLPRSIAVEGNRVRWQLLTPALFPALQEQAHPGGWLPSWIHPESGRVMLPRTKPERQSGERRQAWRDRIAAQASFDCRLVAACTGKPVILTGWSEHLHGGQAGAKTTRLAVPAGSTYYFEGSDAPELAKVLSWDGGHPGSINRRSSALGEKGLGVGVCGPWQPFGEL